MPTSQEEMLSITSYQGDENQNHRRHHPTPVTMAVAGEAHRRVVPILVNFALSFLWSVNLINVTGVMCMSPSLNSMMRTHLSLESSFLIVQVSGFPIPWQ